MRLLQINCGLKHSHLHETGSSGLCLSGLTWQSVSLFFKTQKKISSPAFVFAFDSIRHSENKIQSFVYLRDMFL